MTFARRKDSGAWIVFASDRDGESAIFLMTGDGGSVRKITPAHVCGTRPGWSPQGDRIAFRNGCDTSQALLHIRPGSSTPQVISIRQTFARDAQWSLDGERMLVMSNASDLYITGVDGSGERLLVEDHDLARWSPDGEWVYARPRLTEGNALNRIHATTGRVERLFTTRGWFSNPGWSPDGAHIVLGVEGEGGDELFLIPAEGGALRPIPVELPVSRVFEPRFSPDGSWIAFLGGNLPPIAMHVYRIRSDGSQLERLTETTGLQFNMQWSADGEWLLFGADYDNNSDIYRLRADGSSMQNLTPGPGSDSWPQYAPVSGAEWHPVWLILAALGLIFVLRRFR